MVRVSGNRRSSRKEGLVIRYGVGIALVFIGGFVAGTTASSLGLVPAEMPVEGAVFSVACATLFSLIGLALIVWVKDR